MAAEVDIGAVFQLLGTMTTEQREFRAEVRERLTRQDEKINELTHAVNDHARKLDDLADVVRGHDRKLNDLSSQVTSLREAVTEYHSAVIGHGILYSELDMRLRRVERQLGLGPLNPPANG